MSLRKAGRNWLLGHPKINPYKWFDPGIFRTITAPLRVLPDFMIIGMQKSGSSALYDYIIKHPNVYPALRKETHFFELQMGRRWYRSYFPTFFTKFIVEKIKRGKFITGEATPNYTFFPFCAERISKEVENAKFIIIMRNPVDRAFSQYQMKVRKHQEELLFEEGLEKEEERLKRDKNMSDEEYFNSNNFNRYGYVSRGLYAKQLKEWFDIFPKEKFLILSTEELEKNQTESMDKIFDFLNLPKFTIRNLEKVFTGNYVDKMDPNTRKKLIAYFKPHNEELYKLVGKKFDWDR